MPIVINAYCTHRSPPKLEFAHELNGRRDRLDLDLPEHLEGFAGYVASRGDGMTQVRYHVIQHVLRVQTHVSLTIEDDALDAYGAWALEANAITFLTDGTIRDPAGNVLVHADGADPDKDAGLPYPRDAIRRKGLSMGRLDELGVEVPEALPPVVSEVEVEPRLAIDVARRALALFAVALRAESLASESPLSVDDLRRRSPLSFLALSPNEVEFLEADEPDSQLVIQMSWRYEALAVMAWALGLVEDLGLPTALCDVPVITERVLAASEFLNSSPTLRPSSEVLDALDLHYRLHWAARQARIEGVDVPAGLDPGVILERHTALNWLVRFQHSDWDDVDTPT